MQSFKQLRVIRWPEFDCSFY